MATITPLVPQLSPKTPLHAPKLTCVKSLAASADLTSIPSNYTYSASPIEPAASDPEDSIPVIDFSLLTSGDPDQRSKIIQDLGKACKDWGFFMVINHGVSKSLMKAVIEASNDFFNLTEEEKQEFDGKHVMDPIRCGTSYNARLDKVFFWRDFLKVVVHPEFNFPDKPTGFSELALEYCKRTRELARELLKGVSKSLGLEECYIEKTLDLDSSLQIFVANLYPPCPQPELAMGMPPHSDHGLLSLLAQNEIGGLQLQHNGKWVNVNAIPNSFLVNTGDHLEILSNGKYKSILHRAVVNNKVTRISLAIANGPSLDTIVSPAPELVNNESHQTQATYIPMKYKEYLEFQQSNVLDGKSCLDRVKLTLVKSLAESGGLTSIPSDYAYSTNSIQPAASDPEEHSIPVIDFSMLTSGDLDQRSKMIQDLGRACEDWGGFMLINHGVPESLVKAVMESCKEFFNLTEEEKREFEGKHVFDPIKCGTSLHGRQDKVLVWRDFLKVIVHPEFRFPHKPAGFSELALEFCQKTRKLVRELLKGISENLGFEECYIEKTLDLDSGFQLFAANLYPPCPQPELTIGIPPHSDHGLLTILGQNEIGGLQVQHNEKWVDVNILPNSFFINTGDHLEILSNGKYKSLVHQAVVNNKATRISLAIANGPSLDTIVGPAAELVNNESHPAAYIPMKFKEYLELQQSNPLGSKTSLDRVRV
ncbi:hypothetical protein F0562_028904 [Nyssa sinensis]|uniref:Fe2OG dioxygenase domain-containing protein n=1 Tax=Nyssa sinensis TaxID=561372 RepID=A0A5J5B2G5_9ASTE|nr:hypothetical protein F0562_028904 [Nyssa sinensis]